VTSPERRKGPVSQIAPSTTTYTLRHMYLKPGDEIPSETMGWNYFVKADDEGLALHVWYMEPQYGEVPEV
jgi:hypothetical protein